VPGGVDTNFFKPSPKNSGKLKHGCYRFLCCGKWEERKGNTDLLKSFCEEFRPDEKVELVLHCFNPYIPGFDLEREVQELNLPAHASIVCGRPLPPADLATLYNSCDAFVLPTKAEGWGLPIIEAMACGLPVIVTDYSAHTEYVNSQNGYLIRVEKMIDVSDPMFFEPGQDYGKWAQPDLDHLKYLMRSVFENRKEAAQKGLAARDDVSRNWTWDRSARIAGQYLSRLALDMS